MRALCVSFTGHQKRSSLRSSEPHDWRREGQSACQRLDKEREKERPVYEAAAVYALLRRDQGNKLIFHLVKKTFYLKKYKFLSNIGFLFFCRQALVEEQMVQENELVRMRRARYIPDIPDTLYMVEEKPRAMGAAGVDVLAAALPGIQIIIAISSNYAY